MNQTETTEQRAQRLADEWVSIILTHHARLLLGEDVIAQRAPAQDGGQWLNTPAIYGAARSVAEFHKALEQCLRANPQR